MLSYVLLQISMMVAYKLFKKKDSKDTLIVCTESQFALCRTTLAAAAVDCATK